MILKISSILTLALALLSLHPVTAVSVARRGILPTNFLGNIHLLNVPTSNAPVVGECKIPYDQYSLVAFVSPSQENPYFRCNVTLSVMAVKSGKTLSLQIAGDVNGLAPKDISVPNGTYTQFLTGDEQVGLTVGAIAITGF